MQIFSHKSRKCNTLKFSKSIIFIQQMPDTAPNHVYVFKKKFWGDAPVPPFHGGTP